jgi:hypothetical protein
MRSLLFSAWQINASAGQGNFYDLAQRQGLGIAGLGSLACGSPVPTSGWWARRVKTQPWRRAGVAS